MARGLSGLGDPMPMPAPTPTLLAVACLLLAGCSSAPAPSAPGDVPEAAAPTTPISLSGPAPSATDVAQAAFTMDGQTPVGYCAFAPFIGRCDFTGDQDSFRELHADGRPLRVTGTMHWNGTVPPSVVNGDPLLLAVRVLHQENGNWTFGRDDPWAEGPSPLHFELPLAAFSSPVALSVDQSVGTAFAAGYAGVLTPQAFHLDGVLEFVAASPVA
jgi:hypothetical protein